MDIASAPAARRRSAEPGGFAPVSLIDGDPAGGFIVLCDHAGNRLPREYGDLGLTPADLGRHIAFDPGAAAVARRLAGRLDAPAVLANFSRLLIDPNRGADDPTLIVALSDGTVVPANVGLDEAERRRRIERFYAPYHDAVDEAIERALAAGRAPALVSIHSFTPVWRGRMRPWHAGILWDADPRLAGPLVAALRADSALVVGDNEPYSGTLTNDTLHGHGTRRGLAHALIEIRQDLIAGEEDARDWAERLAAILADLNRREELHEIRHHASRAGRVRPL